MLNRRRLVASLIVGAGFLALNAGFATAAAPGEPVAVTGPITGGKQGRMFNAFLDDANKIGYVDEEFFIAGEAQRYRLLGEMTGDGKWSVEAAGTGPYKTRIVVRRPRDAAKFNGTVLVEWLNVSAGHDLTVVDESVWNEGFAYVGVSAQYVSVNGFEKTPQGLKAWDPERYGSLSIPAESLSYDIFTQAGRAVGPSRPKTGVDPMGGLPVRKLIAIGGSQSAARLLTYINAIQPREKAYDAFVPSVGAGFAVGFYDNVMDFSKIAPEEVIRTLFRVQSRVRDDLLTPVMIVNSEAETLGYAAVRQPDTAKFRYWEVAGASHAPGSMIRRNGKMFGRDGVATVTPPVPPSEVDWVPVATAAYYHVHNWINGGKAPPSQSKIEIKAGAKPEIVRDAQGNARGGVRLPDVEVPIARYAGSVNQPGFGALGGQTEPLPPEKLKELYPSTGDYVRKVTDAARSAEKNGVIRPRRTNEYIEAAKAVKI